MKQTAITTTQNEENFLKGIEDALNIPLNVGQEIKILSLLEVLKSDLNKSPEPSPIGKEVDKTTFEVAIGHEVSNLLFLKFDKAGRVKTNWGVKSVQSLGACITRIIEEQSERVEYPTLYRENARLTEQVKEYAGEIDRLQPENKELKEVLNNLIYAADKSNCDAQFVNGAKKLLNRINK